MLLNIIMIFRAPSVYTLGALCFRPIQPLVSNDIKLLTSNIKIINTLIKR